uniref:Uncharacterized protein n=1 Tax=Salix viminalis TaxID=40686 RepID=A0A6N2LW73_SALVM
MVNVLPGRAVTVGLHSFPCAPHPPHSQTSYTAMGNQQDERYKSFANMNDPPSMVFRTPLRFDAGVYQGPPPVMAPPQRQVGFLEGWITLLVSKVTMVPWHWAREDSAIFGGEVSISCAFPNQFGLQR